MTDDDQPRSGPDPTDVIADGRQAFQTLHDQLAVLPLTRPLEPIEFWVHPHDGFTSWIWRTPALELTVTERLLRAQYDVVARNADAIMRGIRAPWAMSRTMRRRRSRPANDTDDVDDVVLTALHTLLVHFVLTHEIAHLLCGHVFVPQGEVRQDYFMELEADNTATEIIATTMVFDDVHRALQAERATGRRTAAAAIVDLVDDARIVAFRLLLTACWLEVVLFEAHRGTALLAADSHPLPSARLFASVGTVFRLFAPPDDERLDTDGHVSAAYDPTRHALVRTFLQDVLKPVALALMDLPAATGLALPLGTDASPGDRIVVMIQDVANLMLSRPLYTAGAQQLSALEALRRPMDALLAPHRYIEGRRYD